MRQARIIFGLALTVTLTATIQVSSVVAGSSEQYQRDLSGSVIDPNGAALVGASVTVLFQDKYLVGAACDTAGRFALSWSALSGDGSLIPDNQLRFVFSAIGFESVTVSLPYVDNAEMLRVELTAVTIELSGVVSQVSHVEDDRQLRTNAEITKSAERSFLSSNPLEAVRGAGISRSGSAFGSQVRFSGSIPEHSLNGISLGVDPAHYGMFAQLPGASVARMSFTDQTQSAAAGSATAIELESDRSFAKRNSGSVSLSALESVGAYRYSSGSAFLSGSLRKSVLDKLIRHVKVENVRATIPPTNYEDIFFSAGYQLKPGSAIFLDQLFTQDFLAYNTQSTSLNTAGVETFQHTRRQNSALSFRRNTARTIFKAFISYEKFKSQYRAAALDADPLALALDLAERGQRIQSGVDYSLDNDRSQYRVGASYGYRSNPNINLSQRNWNFLPPQSTSDNPYYYQASLNALYDELSIRDRGEDLALYADYKRRWYSWRLMTGLRAQFNDYLARRADVLARMTLTHEFNERQTFQLSIGSYAESPVRNLIDPYQILIRNNLSELKSEKTYLAKLTFTNQGAMNRKFSASVFTKRMTDLPALTPKFNSIRVLSTRVYALGELDMRAEATRVYSGFSVSYEGPAAFTGTLSERLQLRTSYAYTYSSEMVSGVSTALSEDAPHRFEFDLGCDAGKSYEFGFQLFARSGYRYTEPSAPQAPVFGFPTVYTENSYVAELSQQNRERFPLNLNVNLSARRTFGAVTVYMNVGNVFDRANPLVRTFDNYVYDAGVLPSIGAKYSF